MSFAPGPLWTSQDKPPTPSPPNRAPWLADVAKAAACAAAAALGTATVNAAVDFVKARLKGKDEPQEPQP